MREKISDVNEYKSIVSALVSTQNYPSFLLSSRFSPPPRVSDLLSYCSRKWQWRCQQLVFHSLPVPKPFFHFNSRKPNCSFYSSFPSYASSTRVRRKLRALKEETEESAEAMTEKFGLESGLWKIFSSKEEGKKENEEKSKTDQAKELLAKYGGAYLATSISLSLISFALCYLLVSAGIDVQALLQKVGISTNEAGEKVGTFALAYAAHKAASPIRFPPTVALTPIVASWIGKKAKGAESDDS